MRKHVSSPFVTIAITSLALSSAAWAGPRVGDVVGATESASITAQARVVSSTPVVAQVSVPHQVCYDEVHQDPARSTGAGAVLGAIAGGAAGNAVGKGSGKALATGVGILGGAILGDHVEMDGKQGTSSTVRRCEQQSSYENRVVAYSVVYEYAGQQFTTQMTQEPGSSIPLRVTMTPLIATPVVSAEPPPEVIYEENGRRHHRD